MVPQTAGTVERMLLRHRAVLCVAGDRHGEDRAGDAETDAGAVFGVVGVLAPQALGEAYGVPSSPHRTQLLRLFGSRMLASPRGPSPPGRGRRRVLAVAAAMNVVDVLIALAAARTTGATAVRAAATSATFAALGLAVRSLGGLSRRLRRRRSGWAR
jgi:hypothetical protein